MSSAIIDFLLHIEISNNRTICITLIAYYLLLFTHQKLFIPFSSLKTNPKGKSLNTLFHAYHKIIFENE